jgi:hypothetical protein
VTRPWDLDPVDLDGTGGLAVDHGHRRLPPQGLLHHRVEQRRVGPDAVEHRGLAQEREEAAAHGRERRLGPGREQQPQEPVDVLVAEALTIDLGGDDV